MYAPNNLDLKILYEGIEFYRNYMDLIATKPVFGVSGKASFKPVSSGTDTCLKIEILLVANLDMILSKK